MKSIDLCRHDSYQTTWDSLTIWSWLVTSGTNQILTLWCRWITIALVELMRSLTAANLTSQASSLTQLKGTGCRLAITSSSRAKVASKLFRSIWRFLIKSSCQMQGFHRWRTPLTTSRLALSLSLRREQVIPIGLSKVMQPVDVTRSLTSMSTIDSYKNSGYKTSTYRKNT